MRSSPALVLALTFAVACGARSALNVAGGGQGGDVVSSSVRASSSEQSTGVGLSSSASAGTGGSLPACTHWEAGPEAPLALTETIGDSLLTSLVADANDVLVASTNDNDPSPDPTWRVRRVSDDLSSVGASNVVLSRQGLQVSFSGMSLADRYGHRAGVAWDEVNACRFVALAEDGSAAGAPKTIANESCFWLTPTPQGFLVFTSPGFQVGPLTLHTLDPNGVETGSKTGLVPAQNAMTFPLPRAVLDDGSLWLFWRVNDDIVGQRFSEDGAPLTPIVMILASAPHQLFSSSAAGAFALVAWTPDNDVGKIFSATLGKDGVLSAPIQLTTQDLGHISSVAVAVAGPGALVATTTGAAPTGSVLVIPTTTLGAPSQAPFALTSPGFTGSSRMVATPTGAMIAYQGESPGFLTQVFVSRLLCTP